MRILALTIVLAFASCTTFYGRVYGGLTQASVSGDVALQNSAGNLDLGSNQVGLRSELGIEKSEVLPYVRGEVGLPVGAVTVSGFGFRETATGMLAPNHQFGEVAAGSQVSSRLQFTNVKAAFHFNLIDVGVLRLSPGLGVDLFDIDAEVRQLSNGTYDRVDNLAPVPMLFGQAEVDLGPVAATVDGGWMSADLKDADGIYYDVEALVRVNPSKHLELFAGYRFITLDARGVASGRGYEAELTIHGWMFGGGVVF